MAAKKPLNRFLYTWASYRNHNCAASKALPSARRIVNELRANMVRVEANFSATPVKAKIADAEQSRVHTMLVIGARDMEAGAVSVRLHHGGPQGAKPKGEVIADILTKIRERSA